MVHVELTYTRVMKVARAAGLPTRLAWIPGDPLSHYPTDLVVDASSLYWSDERAGTILKLTPK